MEQKRFLTADEVFQMFGVDSAALEELVNSGAVQPLADAGSFKYRTLDFVALVENGALTPRVAGELFRSDSDGNIPFIDSDDTVSTERIDDEVSFLELDEEALNEQAIQPDNASVPDSDSDVRIVSLNPSSDGEDSTTDSENAILGFPAGAESAGLKAKDSDSDVRLSALAGDDLNDPDSDVESTTTGDDDIKLVASSSDSDVTLVGAEKLGNDPDVKLATTGSDSDVTLVGAEKFAGQEISTSKASDSDSDVSLVDSHGGMSDEESGIRLMGDDSSGDSGIRLAGEDSGIRLDEGDSGISLEGDGTDISRNSGIQFDSGDSGITLKGADSGISLVGADADSGIRFETDDDSGISLGGTDSGISLIGDDSGISLGGGDSGITLEDDVFDPKSDIEKQSRRSPDTGKPAKKEAPPAKKGSASHGRGNAPTQALDLSDEQRLQDSGFDVSLTEEDQTAELHVRNRNEETPGYPATIVSRGEPTTTLNATGPSLSETFQMDEPPEVEDLDISDDLEGAPSSDFSGEFAAVDEDEVFEASDADFSGAEIAEAEEAELSDEEVVPAAKVRKGPREPEWGMMVVAPVAVAALLMLATVTTLWGGIATMWTGAEAPGPAATLISTLAGLSPF